jgi:hypothetical protein
VRELQADIDEIDDRTGKLELRDDAEFIRLHDRIHTRYFAQRRVQRILHAELVIA